MKHRFVLLVSLILLAFDAASARVEPDFGDAHRFIFYAVLEGCFEDGIATEDVSQILLQRPGEGYVARL